MSTANTDTGDTVIEAGIQATPTSALAPREQMISTAVDFLRNARVRHTSLMEKQKFLRDRGMTLEEIQLACERAGVFTHDPNSPTVINMGFSTQTHSQLAPQPLTFYGKLKEVLHLSALISGIAYALYMFWKKVILSFLFGKKKKKPIEDTLVEIDEKVETRISEVKGELTQMKDSLTQQQREQNQQFTREFNHFRSDLEAIKGLLLNRKQFASPLTGAGAAPSIPAWQLSSSPHLRHCRRQPEDIEEKTDDAGSGSGSSETEVVTKNSDSSLEIM